jgi:hypothetical protein
MRPTVDIDLTRIRVEDLPTLPEPQFRALVDLDLRRDDARRRTKVPAPLSAGLRSPACFERWAGEIQRIHRSLETQLETRLHDCESRQAEIERELLKNEGELANARDPKLQASYERDIGALRMQAAELKMNYHNTRNRTVRFKSVVQEVLDEIQSIRAGSNDSARVRELEEGIVAHRAAVLLDLQADEEPDEIDLTLWALVEQRS